MSDRPTNDPGYVFQRFGLGLILLSTISGMGLIAAIALNGLRVENRLTFYLLGGAVALPFLGGMGMANEWFRGLLIDAAHALPFVKFEKKAEPPANG